jgi:hypothetical protein
MILRGFSMRQHFHFHSPIARMIRSLLWVLALMLAPGLIILAGAPARAASSTLVISEALYDPTTTEPDGEWIEIYNLGGTTIDLSNVKVGGAWSNGASGTAACATNSNGQCTVSKGAISKRNGSVTFTVASVTHATLTYNSSDNHDPDGDSNGTTITVARP